MIVLFFYIMYYFSYDEYINKKLKYQIILSNLTIIHTFVKI